MCIEINSNLLPQVCYFRGIDNIFELMSFTNDLELPTLEIRQH